MRRIGDRYRYESTPQLGFGGGLTPAVKALIIANVAVFLLQTLLFRRLPWWFGLIPAQVVGKFYLWQLVTYMFLHGGFFHILFNMLALWFFGSEIERHWGSKEFVKYYFLTGVGAGIIHILFSFWLGSPRIPVIGASGAVYGVLLAFGLMFPDRVVTLLLFFVLPVSIKAKYLVMMFAAIALFSGVLGTGEGVAHFAHLGGMAVGWLYLKLDWRLERSFGFVKRHREARRRAADARRRAEIQRMRDQIDAILDKINEVGFENLSEQEKRLLREASRFLSEKKELE